LSNDNTLITNKLNGSDLGDLRNLLELNLLDKNIFIFIGDFPPKDKLILQSLREAKNRVFFSKSSYIALGEYFVIDPLPISHNELGIVYINNGISYKNLNDNNLNHLPKRNNEVVTSGISNFENNWIVFGNSANWLKAYLQEYSNDREVIVQLNIIDDISYQNYEFKLNSDIRLRMANFRSQFLIDIKGVNQIVDVIKVLPVWIIQKEITVIFDNIRVLNCLKSENIKIVSQLQNYPDEKLKSIPNFGLKTISVIYETLLNLSKNINHYPLNSISNANIQVDISKTKLVNDDWLDFYFTKNNSDRGKFEKLGISNDYLFEKNYQNCELSDYFILLRERTKFLKALIILNGDFKAYEISYNCAILPSWILNNSLINFELNNRVTNAFDNYGIKNFNDLIKFSNSELLRIPNIGLNSLIEIRNKIARILYLISDAESFDGINLLYSAITGKAISKVPVSQLYKKEFNKNINLDLELSLSNEIPDNFYDSFKFLLSKAQVSDIFKSVFLSYLCPEGKVRTLQEVGTAFGLSRERIRQIITSIQNRFNPVFRNKLHEKIENIRRDMVIPLLLQSIHIYDDWFLAPNGEENGVQNLLRITLNGQIKIHNFKGQEIIAPGEIGFLDKALLSTNEYVRSKLKSGISKEEIFEYINNLIGIQTPELVNTVLSEFISGAVFGASGKLVSLQSSTSAMIIQILSNSKKPLSCAAIRQILIKDTGQDISENYIRNICSNSAFLFNKSTFGFKNHLPFSARVIESINSSIVKLMLDGPEDKQWHAQELMEYLRGSSNFSSVKLDHYLLCICLSFSDKVIDLGRMVFTLKTNNKKVKPLRIHFSSFVESLLENSDVPLSTKEIIESISKERGTSDVVQIHQTGKIVSIAPSMWGLIDKHLNITNKDYEFIVNSCEDILNNEQIGLTYQELKEKLSHKTIVFTHLSGYTLASLFVKSKKGKREDIYIYPVSWDNCRRVTATSAIYSSISNASKNGFTVSEILNSAIEMYGHEITKYQIFNIFEELNIIFNSSKNIWVFKKK